MIADNLSSSILHSSSSFVLYWMRGRKQNGDVISSVHTTNSISIPHLPFEDKEEVHQTGIPFCRKSQHLGSVKAKSNNECLAGDDKSPHLPKATHRRIDQDVKPTGRIKALARDVNSSAKRVSNGENHRHLKEKKSDLYKTEMCRNWQEIGYCRYGKKCRYAHGQTELRVVKRHQRYKTEVCRTYHETGSCPYGVRCTFIHDGKSSANPNIVFCNGKAHRTEKGKSPEIHTFADAHTVPPSPELSVGSTASSSLFLVDLLAGSSEGISDDDYTFASNDNEVTAGSVTDIKVQNPKESCNVKWTDNTMTHLTNETQFPEQHLLNTGLHDQAHQNVIDNRYQLPRSRSMDNIAPRLCDYFSKLSTEQAYQTHGDSSLNKSHKEERTKRISTRVASSSIFSWQT